MENDHWLEVEVNQLADVFLGITPGKTDYSSTGPYKVIKFRDVNNGAVIYSNDKNGFIKTNIIRVKNFKELKVGDVLITSAAHSGDNIGKKTAYVDLIPSTFDKVYFTGELLNIRSPYLAKWIYYYFCSDVGFKEIQNAVKGVHLTSGRASLMTIPLPPLAEQNRIVKKLDAILPRVKTLKDRLDKIPRILKTFRQSVLSAACSGKLTEDWREGHPDVAPVKIDNMDSYDPDNIFYEASLVESPENWCSYRLISIGDIKSGATPSKSASVYWGGNFPWVSAKDMKFDFIEDSIDKITKKALQETNIKVIPANSILFVVRGMILIHTFPVALTKRTLTINQDLKALIPKRAYDPSYLLWFFKSQEQAILQKIKEASHGTRRLEMTTLENWAVATPPLEEQHEIVRRVEALFKLAKSIEAKYKKAMARVDKIEQAVLAKAFRGELVDQDPKDEPAEELLKRILVKKGQ